MKLSKLKIGQPLTKEEQKAIKGGRPCADPETLECLCVNGNVATGANPADAVIYCENICSTNGGYLGIECIDDTI